MKSLSASGSPSTLLLDPSRVRTFRGQTAFSYDRLSPPDPPQLPTFMPLNTCCCGESGEEEGRKIAVAGGGQYNPVLPIL